MILLHLHGMNAGKINANSDFNETESRIKQRITKKTVHLINLIEKYKVVFEIANFSRMEMDGVCLPGRCLYSR